MSKTMEFTRDELHGLIRDIAGKELADVIRENIEKALEPFKAQQTDWFSKMNGQMLGDGSGRQQNGGGRMTDVKVPALEPGIALTQYAKAVAWGKMTGGGQQAQMQWAKQHAHADVYRDMQEQFEKALAAGDGPGGGFLVPQQYSQDIINLLRPQSVVRQLGPNILPMPVGSMRIPKVTAGVTGYYIGENQNITPSQPQFGQITLTWKKLAALVPISNDLIRYSSPGADTIVRNDIVRALAQRENQAFLRDTGTEFTPKGMRYWANPAGVLTSAGTTLANMITDLSALVLLMKTNLIPMTKPAWILNPRSYMSLYTIQNTNGFFVFRDEMTRGNLWGYPYAVTIQIPGSGSTGEYYLADMDDAAIGEAMQLSVDASMEAAYYDGSNVVAAYSQDQTVIRAIAEHDFAMRRAESVTVMGGLSY